MHAFTAALSLGRDCGVNAPAAVVVGVDVCALVDMHTFDIDPDDPTNISSLFACEWTHLVPQSVRVKDVAP